MHYKPEQIWSAILMGLFFGYIYFKTKSVGTVILLHSFANACVFILKYYQTKFNTVSFGNALTIALIMSSSIALLFIVRRLVDYLKIESFNK
jgi:membrane protease YdiL (CAAX protease family)